MNDRRGFTIIELLVVSVLGALVIVATFNVLITNQQIYTAQTAQMQGQQAVRAGIDVLFSELREVSARDGDILSMSSNEIVIRAMRATAIICDTVQPAGNTDIALISIPVDTPGSTSLDIAANDTVWLFSEHDSSTTTDDEWNSYPVGQVDTLTCQGFKGQEITVTGNAFLNDTPTLGSLVRATEIYTWGLDTLDGESYLARTSGATKVPLIGPLQHNTGLTFTYYDANGNVTATPADVRSILVKLRSVSDVHFQGDTIADSLTARVYTRN